MLNFTLAKISTYAVFSIKRIHFFSLNDAMETLKLVFFKNVIHMFLYFTVLLLLFFRKHSFEYVVS